MLIKWEVSRIYNDNSNMFFQNGNLNNEENNRNQNLDNDGFTSAISTSDSAKKNIAPSFNNFNKIINSQNNVQQGENDKFQKAVSFQNANPEQSFNQNSGFKAPAFSMAQQQQNPRNNLAATQNGPDAQSFSAPQFNRFNNPQAQNSAKPNPKAPDISNNSFGVHKKANLATKLMLAAIIVMFLGIAFFIINNIFFTQHKEIGIISYSKDIDAFSGSAVIVRDEKVVHEKDVANINFIAQEGSQIAKSSHVCTIYTNGLTKTEINSLQQTRAEISKQQQALIKALPVKDTRLSAIDDNLKKLVATTQNLILGSPGNILLHEQTLKNAVAQRQSYIKSKFTDDTKLQRLYDTEINQVQKLETWAKQLISDDNGIVSFYTDGLENEITPENMFSKSTTNLIELIQGKTNSQNTKTVPVYRIVQPNKWYVVLHVNSRDWTPTQDEEYQLTIENFDNTTVKAKVIKIARNDINLYVWLEVDDSVLPILYTRNCQVHISKKKDSFSVPKSAVVEKDGKNYIVLTFREGNYSLEIEILKHDNNEVHFVPKDNISLLEGMKVLLYK